LGVKRQFTADGSCSDKGLGLCTFTQMQTYKAGVGGEASLPPVG